MRRAGDLGFFKRLHTNQPSHLILNGLLDTDRAHALETHQPSDKHPVEWVLLKLASQDESLAAVIERYRQEYEKVTSRKYTQRHSMDMDEYRLIALTKALMYSIEYMKNNDFDIAKLFPAFAVYYEQLYPDLKIRNAKIILDQINSAIPLPAAHYFLAVLYQEGQIVEEKDNMLAIEHYLKCLATERTQELDGHKPLFSSACEDALLVLRKECGITAIGNNTTLVADSSDQRYLWELARWCKHPAALNKLLTIGSDLLASKNPDLFKVHSCFVAVNHFSTSPISTRNGYELEKCYLRTTDISLSAWEQSLSQVHHKAKMKLIELILRDNIEVALQSLIALVQPLGLWSEMQNIYLWYMLYRDFAKTINLVRTDKDNLKKLGIYNNIIQAILQFDNTTPSLATDCELLHSTRQEFIQEAEQHNEESKHFTEKIDLNINIYKFGSIMVMILMDMSENQDYVQMSGFKQFKDFADKILARIPDATETYNGIKQLRESLKNGNHMTRSLADIKPKKTVAVLAM